MAVKEIATEASRLADNAHKYKTKMLLDKIGRYRYVKFVFSGAVGRNGGAC